MMLNYTILPRVAEVDYYLERISIKLVNLFGVFYDVLLFIIVAIVFCSIVLWIILPVVELRKKSLLKKIYAQLIENQEVLCSINQHLADLSSPEEEVFTQETKD